MSSTNRGYERHISDFYITPQEPIKNFLNTFLSIESLDERSLILDPSAGGNGKYDMPYPAVLSNLGFKNIATSDIRYDSNAGTHQDFLKSVHMLYLDLIITNPPFNLALDFIKKALDDVKSGGFVVMLLRLNFFGSQGRHKFFQENMPKYCFIHSKRISFFPEDFTFKFFNKKKNEWESKFYAAGSTDSCEYAHFVWQKGYKENYCKTYVI